MLRVAKDRRDTKSQEAKKVIKGCADGAPKPLIASAPAHAWNVYSPCLSVAVNMCVWRLRRRATYHIGPFRQYE